MKKLLYSLSAALICGLTATAATPQLDGKDLKSFTSTAALQQVNTPAKMMAKPIDNQTRKIGRKATTADFLGHYMWVGINQLEVESLPSEGTLTIVAGENGRVQVLGLLPGYPLDGYVDNSRLIIPNQYIYTTSDGQPVYFWNHTLTVGQWQGQTSYFLAKTDKVPFYFTLTPDGILFGGTELDQTKFDNFGYTDAELEQNVCLAGLVPFGLDAPEGELYIYWLVGSINGQPFDVFSFREDEWDYVGVATFKDAWFPVLWEDLDPKEYEVDLYQYKSNKSLLCLYNPYGPESAYRNVNTSTATNYLVCDISNPDCVTFQPLVYSMSLAESMMYEDGSEDKSIEFYNYNLEGFYYYVGDIPKEDIIDNFTLLGVSPSYYDANDRVIAINNAVFSMEGYNLFAYADWGSGIDMSGYIELPENFDDAVESIISDNENAPTEYFNLQGVKVLNPEKGQLVIVRKGNQVAKIIK